jgi:hypothetical protein
MTPATRALPVETASPAEAAHNAMLDMIETSVRTALDLGLAAPLAARLDRLLPRAPTPSPLTTEHRLGLASARTHLGAMLDKRTREAAGIAATIATIDAIIAASKPESTP